MRLPSDSPKRPLPAYVEHHLDGTLRIDVPTFLREVGWPDTPEYRVVATQIIRDVCAELLPGVPQHIV